METNTENAREQVLGDIRRALKQQGESNKKAIDEAFSHIRSSPLSRPVVDGVLLDRFIDRHTAVHGSVKIVASFAEVPVAVDEFLSEHDLPSEMVMGNTEFLIGFDWPRSWKISTRSAVKTDAVSVTDAVCAIAETGTIVIASTSEVSSTHLFLPENHIVIFNAGQIVRHLEDALKIVTPQVMERSRGTHMITGPSKTADVEQTIQYGAHGPRRLHAVVIDTK